MGWGETLIQKHVTRFLLLVQLLRPRQALQCRVLYRYLMHHGSYSACSGRKAFLSAFVALVARTRSSIPKDTRQLQVQRPALRSKRSVRESQARRGPNFPNHHPWKSMAVLSDSREESTHPPTPLNNTIPDDVSDGHGKCKSLVQGRVPHHGGSLGSVPGKVC